MYKNKIEKFLKSTILDNITNKGKKAKLVFQKLKKNWTVKCRKNLINISKI